MSARVLFLSYYFPPIGGAGGQRNPRLVRNLPAHGYEPVVVTGPGSPSYRWTPIDPSLDVGGAEVHRLAGPEPARSGGWAVRAERWLGRTSPWKRWWHEEALRTVRRVGPVDLVHASIAPYDTAETAVAVARALDVPLVVDFEDPWALDEFLVYPSALHRKLDLGRMLRTLRAADEIVMNTPESARRVRELVPGRRVSVVSNGYDEGDFAGPDPAREAATFRIVHTGSLHTDLGLRRRNPLGGMVKGVDFLTRSHVHLVEALRYVDDPLVELHLAGGLTDADRRVLEGAPFRWIDHGFLPHPETIALLRSADLLFLPMHDTPRPAIVPCKTYEYVASGRPILAAVPEGDVRDIVAAAGTAEICAPSDVDAIAEAVERVLHRSSDAPAPNPAVLARYEFGALTAELAAAYAPSGLRGAVAERVLDSVALT